MINFAPFGADVLVAVIALLAWLFVCRELVTWYWKIDRVVELLEQLVEQNERAEERAREAATRSTYRNKIA